MQQLTGKSQAQRQAEIAAGVDSSNAQLGSLKVEAVNLENQMNQALLNTAPEGMGQRALVGEKARIQNSYMLQIGANSAMQQALQGNIELAIQTATKTVNAAYEPIENDLKVALQKLEFKQGDLTKAEAKANEAQKQAILDEQAKITDEKNTKNTLMQMAVEAGKNGASNEVMNAIINSTDASEAFKIGAQYIAKEIPNTDIVKLDNGNTILIDKNSGDIIRQFGGAKTVDTSSINSSGVSFKAGSVPFQATIENAASMEGSVAGNARTLNELGNLAASGDYKSLLVRLQNQAKKGMAAADKTEVTKAEKQVSAMNRMQKVLKEYENAGGDMGYLKGTKDKIATRIGKLAVDPKFKSIATELTAAFQQYRADMTGAAFGAQESAEYAQVIPTEDKTFELNAAIMDGLKNYMKEKVDSSYSIALGEGYQNVKGLAENPPVQQKKATSLNELYNSSPELQTQIENILNDNPNLSEDEVMQILGQ